VARPSSGDRSGLPRHLDAADAMTARPVVKAVAADPSGSPACLLYLLPMGHDREVVLALHGSTPADDELALWLASGASVTLTVSREGIGDAFSVIVNFATIVLVRTAPYTVGRHVTF